MTSRQARSQPLRLGQDSAGLYVGRVCTRLLEEAGVSITPGTVFGPRGEGYVRISLGMATERIRRGHGPAGSTRILEEVQLSHTN